MRSALASVSLDAPQGMVRIDPENRHAYLRPRIGLSRADGTFRIVAEYPAAVRPDPYLVWEAPAGDRRGRLAAQAGVVTMRDLTSFRGARALVIHPDDASRETLARTLKQLGLLVAEVGSDNETAILAARADCDILFYDADQTPVSMLGADAPDVPHVALIGHEVPSRLARVARQRCCGFLLKPVRATGVFSALYLAFNEAAVRRREAAERAALVERQRGRRFVVKAILRLCAERHMDDEAAFRWLRRESMQRRVSIERIAEEMVASAARRGSGAGRDDPEL